MKTWQKDSFDYLRRLTGTSVPSVETGKEQEEKKDA